LAVLAGEIFTGAHKRLPLVTAPLHLRIGVSGDYRMPESRPNILFIVVDDCGYADLSCTGQTDYRTPALDRLAAEGIRFNQAYANSVLCTNTRVALITGRYQYRLPIGLVEPLRWSDRQAPEMGVPPGFPTLPSLLRGAGYRTAHRAVA
jgi:arylsulfatase A-like enzyme